jgi:hypothetical protein
LGGRGCISQMYYFLKWMIEAVLALIILVVSLKYIVRFFDFICLASYLENSLILPGFLNCPKEENKYQLILIVLVP